MHNTITDQRFFSNRLTSPNNKISLKNKILNQSIDARPTSWFSNQMSLDLKVDNLMYKIQSNQHSPNTINKFLMTEGDQSYTVKAATKVQTTPRKRKRDISDKFMEYAYKKSGLPSLSMSL